MEIEEIQKLAVGMLKMLENSEKEISANDARRIFGVCLSSTHRVILAEQKDDGVPLCLNSVNSILQSLQDACQKVGVDFKIINLADDENENQTEDVH